MRPSTSSRALRTRAVRLAAALAIAIALPLLGAGCGSGNGDGDDTLPVGAWAWRDVPGAACSDGSQTGVAVNRGTGDRLVLFLDGGGACWDTLTCFTFNPNGAIAAPGPFGRAQFDARIAAAPGSILDRDLPGNPFATATFVFVPYCTGDAHAGDATQTYPGAPRAWHHRGRANLAADLDWVGGRLPAPADVVVSGASAGGFGALFALHHVADRYPGARLSLVDDSGPPLVGDDFSPVLRALWFASWRLDRALEPICGPLACADDLSAVLPRLAERHPEARLGLLSSRQDEVIRGYADLSAGAFEAALLQLVDERIAPLPGARAFLVPGDSHTMLGRPAERAAGGVPLLEWLRRQVDRDPAWATEGR